MSNRIKELLKVLDLPEDEQLDFLYNKAVISKYKRGRSCVDFNYRRNLLADLAFRMRDEVNEENSDIWAQACWYVVCWSLFKIIKPAPKRLKALMNSEYYVLSRKSIAWIIAALIARELAKGEKE